MDVILELTECRSDLTIKKTPSKKKMSIKCNFNVDFQDDGKINEKLNILKKCKKKKEILSHDIINN